MAFNVDEFLAEETKAPAAFNVDVFLEEEAPIATFDADVFLGDEPPLEDEPGFFESVLEKGKEFLASFSKEETAAIEQPTPPTTEVELLGMAPEERAVFLSSQQPSAAVPVEGVPEDITIGAEQALSRTEPLPVPPELQIEEGAEASLPKEMVAFGRGLAAQVPPTAVGLFTFPVKLISGVGAAFDDFVNTGDIAQAGEGFKQGFSGERDSFGRSAEWWDELAAEAKEIIKGEPSTKAEEFQHILADQVVASLWMTFFGKQAAGATPQVARTAKTVISKAKNSLKTFRNLEITESELANVRAAHQGFGGKTIKSLTSREKVFFETVVRESGAVRAQAFKKGKITTDELVYFWQKYKPRAAEVPKDIIPEQALTAPPVSPTKSQKFEVEKIGDVEVLPGGTARAEELTRALLKDAGITPAPKVVDAPAPAEVQPLEGPETIGRFQKTVQIPTPKRIDELSEIAKTGDEGLITVATELNKFLPIEERLSIETDPAILKPEIEKTISSLKDTEEPVKPFDADAFLEDVEGVAVGAPVKPGPVKPIKAPPTLKIVEPPVEPEVIVEPPIDEKIIKGKFKAEEIERQGLDIQPTKEQDISQAGFVKLPTLNFQTKKQKIPAPIKKDFEDWVGEKQVRLFESDQAINKIEQQVKGKEQEVIPFLIEKTGIPKELNRPDLEKIIKDPKKRRRLQKVAAQAEKHMNDVFQYIKEHRPDMSASEIENYVTHIWDLKKNKVKEAVSWFTTYDPFLRKRFIKTLEEGIKRGYKPKTTNIIEIMRIHDQYHIQTTENIKLVEMLKKLEDDAGTKLIMRADKAPEGWILTDHPVLQRTMATGKVSITVPVKSFNTTIFESIEKIKTIEKTIAGGKVDVSKPLKKLEVVMEGALESRGMTPGEAKAYLNRLKTAYTGKEVGGEVGEKTTETIQKDVTKIIREVNRKFPVDVPILQKMPVRYHPVLEPIMKSVFGRRIQATPIQFYEAVNAVLKQAQLGFSLFHHAALTETAIATMGARKAAQIGLNLKAMYNALKNNRYDIYEKKFEIAKDGIKHGLQIGAISDVHRGMIEDMLTNLEASLNRVHRGLGLSARALRKGKNLWDKALWDYLHNNLKVYGYESLVAKELGAGKNLTQEQITAIKKEVAQFVNDTFGGQNWERMMTDPKTLQIAQWVLLSPDWTYSTIRQAAAPTGLGAVAPETRATRRRLGTRFWAKAILYFGIGTNMLNFALTKHDDAKKRDVAFSKAKGVPMWKNDPGHKTHLFTGRYPDGTKRYIRWGKQFRELPELFYDQMAGQISPVTATLRKAGSKASPNLQLISTIFTGHSLGGFKNKKLADESGWSWVGAATKEIIKAPLPFAFKNTLSESKQFRISDLAFPSSKGMTHFKGKKLFKTAIVKRNLQFVSNIYRALIENNIAADEVWEDAITELKREATIEIGEKVRLGKIDKAGNIRELEALSKEEFRNMEQQVVIENWEILINGVEIRYDAFLMEQEMLNRDFLEEEGPAEIEE